MAFHPLQGGINSSLLGIGVAPRILDSNNQGRELYPRRIDSGGRENTIFVIIMSAVIFITIISIADVIRNYINNYYARRALRNPLSRNTQKEINNTLIANQEGLNASITFMVFCIIFSGLFFLVLSDKILNL